MLALFGLVNVVIARDGLSIEQIRDNMSLTAGIVGIEHQLEVLAALVIDVCKVVCVHSITGGNRSFTGAARVGICVKILAVCVDGKACEFIFENKVVAGGYVSLEA